MAAVSANPSPAIAGELGDCSRQRSFSPTSVSSRPTICSDTNSSELLLDRRNQYTCRPKAQSILGIENGAHSELSATRLTPKERGRVLRSTVKLRRVLGEALDEDVVKQWVIAPKKTDACYHYARSSFDSESASETEIENQSDGEDSGSKRNFGRSRSLGALQNDSTYSAAEKRVTVKRTAKLFSLLGERVYSYSPAYPSPQLHLNAQERSEDPLYSKIRFQDHESSTEVSYLEKKIKTARWKLPVVGVSEEGKASVGWFP